MNPTRIWASEGKVTTPERSLVQARLREPEQRLMQAAAPQVAYRHVQPAGRGMDAHDVFALQRAVGNRGVRALLQRRTDDSGARQALVEGRRTHEDGPLVAQEEGRARQVALFATRDGQPAQRGARGATNALPDQQQIRLRQAPGAGVLHRHEDDLVAYTGGQSGTLFAVKAGKVTYMGAAVSGHPGHGENEPGAGPIPTGRYIIHPGLIRPAVTKSHENATCGAPGISSGFQEITSTDPSPCEGAHYCNVPCPTPDNSAQKCFTPRDCWGPKRIKIEGSQVVVTPSGEKKRRDGFFIHGGNPADAVSSGCVKSLNDDAFTYIRALKGVKGAVPFCVGAACEPKLSRAIMGTLADIIGSLSPIISMKPQSEVAAESATVVQPEQTKEGMIAEIEVSRDLMTSAP